MKKGKFSIISFFVAMLIITVAVPSVADSQSDPCLKYDQNGDGKTGLEEAVHALQIVAGIRNADNTFVNSLGMTFRLIPAGTFMMGSPVSEAGRRDDELLHAVKLSKPFYIQTAEVTQGHWKAVRGGNPSYFSECGDACPVENVSWYDVENFITELNKRGEGIYRLPTEAEWEYAARAGSTAAFANGDITVATTKCESDPNLDSMGWYCGNSDIKTHPAAQKLPNDWGLYDMHGNVMEWCQDRYGAYTGAVTDPTGSASGSKRVFRGGCFGCYAFMCRSAYRLSLSPQDSNILLGFRLVWIPAESVSILEPPENIRTVGDDAKVTVSWNLTEDADFYNIYWNKTGNVSKTDNRISEISGTSYIHTSLTNGTAYYYRVTAANSDGEESELSSEYVVIPDSAVPAAPAGLTATAGDERITVSWNPVQGAASYHIYSYIESHLVFKSDDRRIATINSGTNFTHTNLTNGITYYYRVTAVNADGRESELSSQISGSPSGSNNYYKIIAKCSGMCLDVERGSIYDGADVLQYDCHGDDNQLWKLESHGGGYYKIIAKHSGKCLDVYNKDTADGAAVVQWHLYSEQEDNQLWKLEPKDNGYYSITAKHSGKCLDVDSGSKESGASIQQWECNGTDAQLWKFE